MTSNLNTNCDPIALAKQLFEFNTDDWPTRGSVEKENWINHCVDLAYIELAALGEDYLHRAHNLMVLEDFDSPDLDKLTGIEQAGLDRCHELTGISKMMCGCNFFIHAKVLES